jgi:hypothetical protein
MDRMTSRKEEESEEDVGSDPTVATSRASKDGDGTYVGEAGDDDSFDAGETGAEARSQQS